MASIKSVRAASGTIALALTVSGTAAFAQSADQHLVPSAAPLLAQGGVAKALLAGTAAAPLLAAAAAQSDASTQIGEVVVTAQKRSESIQSVPITVEAVSGDSLRAKGIVDLLQLPELAPTLQQTTTNHSISSVEYSIRGVGTAVFSPSVENSVSTVIDGVSMGRPEFGVVQLFDIKQVEVLEGPQGTLFGKNASAGVVSISTNDPKIGVTEGVAHLSYANADTPSSGNEGVAQAALNIPVSDTSAARIAVFGTYDSPLMKNLAGSGDYGQTEYGVRAKYLWKPTENLDVLLSADVTHEYGAGASVYANATLAPGGFLAKEAATYTPGVVYNDTNDITDDGRPEYFRFTAGGASANLTYRFGGGYSVSDLVSYRFYKYAAGGDVDHFAPDTWDTNDGTKDFYQVTNELKLLSPTTGPLSYVAGLYFFDGLYDSDFLQGANATGLGLGTPPAGEGYIGSNAETAVHANSYAAYAQATYRIIEPLRFIVGGRLTYDQLSSSGVLTKGDNEYALGTMGSFDYRVNKSNVSYKFGLEYDLARDVMLYTSYTRGYKAPGLAVTPKVADPVVGEEIPKAWEVGVKSRLFERRVTLNVSAWDETFEGFQAQAYSQFGTTALLNAGSLKSRGAEGDLTILPITGLTLHANLAYVDAYYQSFAGNPCYPGEATGTSGDNVCLANNTSNASGNQLANSPKWVYTLSAAYEHDVTNDKVGFVELNWYHRSGANFNANGDPQTYQPAYGLLGGDFGVKSSDGRWKLSVFARNLLDKRFSGLLIENPADSFFGDKKLGGDYLTFTTPDSFRTVGVALDAKF